MDGFGSDRFHNTLVPFFSWDSKKRHENRKSIIITTTRPHHQFKVQEHQRYQPPPKATTPKRTTNHPPKKLQHNISKQPCKPPKTPHLCAKQNQTDRILPKHHISLAPKIRTAPAKHHEQVVSETSKADRDGQP